MSVKNMNTGDGETSYANNSGLQKVVISKTWPVLDKTLKDMFAAEKDFPKCLKMVDLGCSSGPNTLFVVSHIMEELSKHNSAPQELEVFLNDLPDNDFNNLFKQLPNFSQKNNKKIKCFLYGAPGSFYGRLFPSNSLHLVHSSYSVHWLSQIPEGLEKKNKENIYIARTSPPQVFEAYSKQYQKDFSRFLKLRGEEIRSGGRMILTFLARSVADPFSRDDFAHYTLLAETLADMVAEGTVEEDDLHSFNVPIYGPCVQEIETATSAEGSFNLEKIEAFRVPWDANEEDYENMVFDKNKSGKFVADCVRAFIEPMLAAHFGSSIIDGVFDIYAKKMAEHLSVERSLYFNLVISLTRK